MNALLLAYLHHVLAFTLMAVLVLEWVLIRQQLNFGIAKAIRMADAIYGASAGGIILIGSLRVMWFEKGADYYLHSQAFWWKMAMFAVIGILSIYPTIVFARWGKTMRAGSTPVLTTSQLSRLKTILNTELLCIATLPLFAYAMAHGVF
jgi:putative membrane protein